MGIESHLSFSLALALALVLGSVRYGGSSDRGLEGEGAIAL